MANGLHEEGAGEERNLSPKVAKMSSFAENLKIPGRKQGPKR
jgi:hypothetical protein